MSESLIQMQRRLVRMAERADKLEMALRELVDMCNSDIDISMPMLQYMQKIFWLKSRMRCSMVDDLDLAIHEKLSVITGMTANEITRIARR